MKRLIVLVSLVMLMCFGFVGCKEKSSTTPPAETTVTVPAGETVNATAPAAEETAPPAAEEGAHAPEAK